MTGTTFHYDQRTITSQLVTQMNLRSWYLCRSCWLVLRSTWNYFHQILIPLLLIFDSKFSKTIVTRFESLVSYGVKTELEGSWSKPQSLAELREPTTVPSDLWVKTWITQRFISAEWGCSIDNGLNTVRQPNSN